MDSPDPDLSDKIVEAIAKAVGTDEFIMLDGYVLLASYQAASSSDSNLLTWWSNSPSWKLLGLTEGASTILRHQVIQRYDEDQGEA